MARKTQIQAFAIVAVCFTLSFYFVAFFRSVPAGTRDVTYNSFANTAPSLSLAIPQHLLHEEATTPKLENATIKAELGRSSWNLFHTMMAKFPLVPSTSESEALKAYIYLFARLYPCGDCARHFQSILQQYPPQVGSRKSASTWACFVHNEVNKSLGKEMFDCGKIGDFYDCGCGGGEPLAGSESKEHEPEHTTSNPTFKELELNREDGLTRGG